VTPLAWLLVAVLAGLGAYLVGWPAWRASRVRESRDLNAERYLAWRGRAPRRSDATSRERMTSAERRRVYAGAALAAVAVLALLAFFASS
jgi:hypothetical protein